MIVNNATKSTFRAGDVIIGKGAVHIADEKVTPKVRAALERWSEQNGDKFVMLDVPSDGKPKAKAGK